jgi:hypothetical protein
MEQDQSSKMDESKYAEMGPDDASKLVKKFAADQKISIELSEEQMEAILKAWNEKDPRMPAEITFHVGNRVVADLKVAGYRYSGDTCCV